MTDVMTAATERQLLNELKFLFREFADDAQYNYTPQRAVIRFKMPDLIQIVGTKYARIIARRAGFSPDDPDALWYRSYGRGEGNANMDVSLLADSMNEALSDLDPIGLLTPLLVGRSQV
jgi:hypothetical protein